jgi:Chaperone for flagella basal body P-ring formation
LLARSIFARFPFAFGIVLGALLSAGLPGEVSAEESRPPPGTPPTPVTRQEVWQAVVAELRRQGLSERQLPRVEDLDLPGALPTLGGWTLRVSSVCWDEGPRRTQFRLECGKPGQCLPFLVYLHDDIRDDVRDGVRDSVNAGARAESCRPALVLRQTASELRPVPAAPPKPTVRAGDRATAVFLSDRLRMTANVTCLERGREGEVIRVRGPDGHVFRARISGPAQLEALPWQ